jgi:hypothetical protein
LKYSSKYFNIILTFSCYNIDGEFRVHSDLQVICYIGAHIFWSYGVALVCLIVWGAGIPIFAFLLLNAEKTKLLKIDVKERFGFLYNGYKKKLYFWEVIIMYRKVAMVFI